MLVFAWITLSMSAILLLFFLIGILMSIRNHESARTSLSLLVPLVFWILGCVWYIFKLTILPYDLVIGAAIGASVFYTVTLIATLKDGFNILIIPSLVATVFSILAAVL